MKARTLEGKYYSSEEFKKSFEERVKKDTWGKGIPMVYLTKEGKIVQEWEDGRIDVISDATLKPKK